MSSEFNFDVAIIGAGVVGLACAGTFAERGLSVVVLEREPQVGTGISSRNSGVIHAGIYYPTGSLKHRLCIRGATLLYEHLANYHVPHNKCGKIIVATNQTEMEALEGIHQRAIENDVPHIEIALPSKLRILESEVSCVGGVLSPETGIVDVHAYLQSLVARAESFGAVVATSAPFLRSRSGGGDHIVEVGGEEAFHFRAGWLLNSAGLRSTEVAGHIEGLANQHIPRQWFAKGHYFSLTGPAPFRHLVYPIPADGGLGVHATLDISGQVRFGPDIDWSADEASAEHLDYKIPGKLLASFASSINKYWPGLDAQKLVPDFAGYRPKISGPDDSPADFFLQFPDDHGVSRLVNLFGIESPGLTASLAIAEFVADRICD